jgi:hypothetical protein
MRTTEISPDENLSWWRRCRRDLALLRNLAAMIFFYWTRGARLRRVFRECEARGEMFWVDDDPAETERRLR